MHWHHHLVADFIEEIFRFILAEFRMINMYGLNTSWSPVPAHQRKSCHKTDDVHDISRHEEWGRLPLGFP
jgi:hypothetical protein